MILQRKKFSTEKFLGKHFFGPKFFIGKHNYLMIVFENDNSKYDFPHYLKNKFVEIFLSLENHFFKNSHTLKILIKKFFGQNFYLVALENHFLKNSYPLNIFIKKCLVEIF